MLRVFFGKKIEIFQSFYFRQKRPGNCVWPYSTKKQKAFLDYKSKKLKKSKTWDFPKGVSPWFWSQILNISIFFILGIIEQENVFHTFLDEQQEISKSLKIGIFPKGLVHGFAPKFEIFPSFYFWQKRPENVL